jgi:hypothetical protein
MKTAYICSCKVRERTDPGRYNRIQEDNTRMDFKGTECEGVNWIAV